MSSNITSLQAATPARLVTELSMISRETNKRPVRDCRTENAMGSIILAELIRRVKEEDLFYGIPDREETIPAEDEETAYRNDLIRFADSLLEEYSNCRALSEGGDDEIISEGDRPKLLEEAEDFFYAATWILQYASLGDILTDGASFRKAEEELNMRLK